MMSSKILLMPEGVTIMQKNTLLFLYMSLLVILPQCNSSVKKKKQIPIKTYKKIHGYRRHNKIQTEEYIAKIEGVECPFCAQAAVALVKNIEGVIDASYRQGHEGYEDGILTFAWDVKKGNVPRTTIEQALVDEEFILTFLENSIEKKV